ncbi:hypothetical protein KDK95_02435 [Actinospica sp. MGRD01-02]|uniref:WXG100 family type VII secretion target n=1 Tax=Actinospica acidithermotolerans TaxID=2828514 RepID=A0A941IHG0_9ACTN|nr:hypothetical protein [Actinospica acidithermotolerans]MBR7825148.1 hypothetical protein [Actinospica acidithermotolerans]
MSMSSGAYSAPSVDESGIYQTEYTGGPAAQQPAGGGASGSSGGGGGSSPSFQVQSDGMRAQAAVIADCGSRAAQVLTNLRAALVSGGEPWGTDDLGKKFGHSYTGPANQGFASIAGLGAALTNVANLLAAQADNYDKVEQHLTDRMNKIGESLGGAAAGSGAGTSA